CWLPALPAVGSCDVEALGLARTFRPRPAVRPRPVLAVVGPSCGAAVCLAVCSWDEPLGFAVSSRLLQVRVADDVASDVFGENADAQDLYRHLTRPAVEDCFQVGLSVSPGVF